MDSTVKNVRSPLFAGIDAGDMELMLGCIGYHIGTYRKGEIIAFEEENINHVGVVLTGAVDMIKEDIWGNRTMLVRSYPEDIFGETFACGEDTLSVVTFVAAEDTKVLFLSFCRVMHTCTHACRFHQTLVENMVERMEAELGYKTTVIATGGIARFVTPMCKTPIIYDKDLLVKGLAVLYRENKR